jgi:eukaryotic-like serine/threonine-protein kinase
MVAMGRGEVPLDDVGLGSVLARRYRLEDRRHDGPAGSVWRAVDETLERRVVVRVLPTEHDRTADVVDAARRAALIEDSRLIRILDVGESGAVTYIVTEHVPGEMLSERLTMGPIAAESARRLVGEVAQALEAAATRGLHHLHLDPTAVTVTADGAVKLSGLAVEAALDGSEAQAPDAASATDARALAHLLYACLTGRWPGERPGGLDVAPVVGGRAVRPAELVAGVPGDLDAVCDDDTLANPAAVVAALQPWAAEKPLTQPRGLSLGGPVRPPAPSPRSEATVWNLPKPDDGRYDTPTDAAHDEAPQGGGWVAVPSQPPKGSPIGPSPAAPRGDGSANGGSHPDTHGGSGDGSSVHAGAAGAARTADTGPAEPTEPSTQAASWRPTAAPAPTETPSYTGLLTPPSTPTVRPDLGTELLGGPATQPLQRLQPTPARPLSQSDTSAPVEWRPAWATHREVDDEALGPFMPVAPVGRPPDHQARTVIIAMTGLVVLGLLLAIWGLWGAFAKQAQPGLSVPTLTISDGVSPAGPTVAGSGAAAGPVTIASVLPLDPFGDQREHPETAAQAIDHNPGTSWRSEGYGSAAFGGRKKGLGLDLDLGSRQVVHAVTIDAPGTGGTVEIRGLAADQKSAAATVLGSATMNDGRTVVTLTQPLTTDHVVVWFTAVTRQAGGDYHVVISEVSLS